MLRGPFSLLGVLVLFAALMGAWNITGCQSSTEPAKTQQEAKEEPTLPPQAMEHFRQAHKFLAEQKPDEALKEFQETVRLAPKAPLAHYWLGQIYFLKREKDQAEKAFRKGLELDPDNYHILAMLGKICSLDRERLNQSEDFLKKALKISPDYLDAHFDLGRVYAMKGDRDRAFREFRYLFEKERDFFLYHFEMGRILEAWGDKKQAMNHYQRSHILNPGFEEASKAVQRLEQEAKTTPPAGGAAPPGAGGTAPKTKTPGKPAGSR